MRYIVDLSVLLVVGLLFVAAPVLAAGENMELRVFDEPTAVKPVPPSGTSGPHVAPVPAPSSGVDANGMPYRDSLPRPRRG
ncbi:MAG: hypothetical protein ACT4PY_18050 [Armatimonadota bacterium]